jgi:dTDP-4-dehydrorhamnose 3,5-epimerase-like enzyme
MKAEMGKGTWEELKFASKGDHRGELVALQNPQEVPFPIRRVYVLTKTLGNVTRGLHAHYNLDQVLIAVSGACRVRVDNGSDAKEFCLDTHTKGLRITNLIWREMFDFSPDCVLLVLASQEYDPEDYIRSYEKFLEIVKN